MLKWITKFVGIWGGVETPRPADGLRHQYGVLSQLQVCRNFLKR